ncbi:lipopolysaccharide transport periplasmic protein LptA [Rhodobacteraceae bacterium HSP-20]|uniref:Lipopolysaccharide transport periplasmic protein LptA n=1 Tax=Paragemmobacter amnigenus TaxID=2852097 RepID=A0ABS6J688_9RHOB|nr:lipopolysaccharide transport periplasmic protein LptA [Rhodobacter amnigenus]MBU9697977.1 lipopolysaccharide transport periplasmic protein LptA [Rhodobacter amnigenus]MBV4389204.1 lipopolysaccharide transport periplasmic protein LptA [Rhodobacter amnigenus]
MAAALRASLLTAALLALTTPLSAQTAINLTGLRQDTSLPVEVAADSLAVDQTDGQATFSGNVKVTQGDMTIQAGEARVEYTPDGKGIDRILLSGRVLFASPTDAAEADEAVYTIDTGVVVLTGDVLLTQGSTTISGGRLVYDLDQGTGSMEGRVQTVFTPGKAQP